MAEEVAQDPFDPYVQELQKQEGDIERKLDVIGDILDKLKFADPQREAELRKRFDGAKKALDELKEGIAGRKIEDLEKELEELEGLIRNPGRFNPQPIPPWVWPWPWPPPPGFPGPGSPTPGVINVGIVTPISNNRHEVKLAERDFITARSSSEVWVWDPRNLAWEAHLNTVDEIVTLDKVDGTIAVWTKRALWLFHPLEYRWLGPLNAEILEVKSFNLAFPTVVEKNPSA